jgi:hypothetical protein
MIRILNKLDFSYIWLIITWFIIFLNIKMILRGDDIFLCIFLILMQLPYVLIFISRKLERYKIISNSDNLTYTIVVKHFLFFYKQLIVEDSFGISYSFESFDKQDLERVIEDLEYKSWTPHRIDLTKGI